VIASDADDLRMQVKASMDAKVSDFEMDSDEAEDEESEEDQVDEWTKRASDAGIRRAMPDITDQMKLIRKQNEAVLRWTIVNLTNEMNAVDRDPDEAAIPEGCESGNYRSAVVFMLDYVDYILGEKGYDLDPYSSEDDSYDSTNTSESGSLSGSCSWSGSGSDEGSDEDSGGEADDDDSDDGGTNRRGYRGAAGPNKYPPSHCGTDRAYVCAGTLTAHCPPLDRPHYPEDCDCTTVHMLDQCCRIGGSINTLLVHELKIAMSTGADSDGYLDFRRDQNNLQRKRCYRAVALDFPYTYRTELPTCAVSLIRQAYPSVNGVYMGYKEY